MINADAEIERLRWYLNSRDLPNDYIDDICDLAAQEIGDMILEIVDNAVVECIDYASEIGCDQFVEELSVVSSGNGYRIMTISGTTNFSVPEFPMKEALINGPKSKVSKEGKRYNTIPIGGNSGRSAPPVFTSSFQVQQSRQALLNAARDAMSGDSAGRDRSMSTRSITDDYRNRLAATVEERKRFYSLRRSEMKAERKDAEPTFRNVSEDSPDDSWMRPERELDMTGFLMDINSRIEDNMSNSITSLIGSYTSSFGDM